MIPRKLNRSRNAVGRGPPIFRYRFYPLAHRARWIDKAAKSRRITGIVPEKRRCHGRWYKGRGPVDRRQRKFALRSGPYRGRPVTFRRSTFPFAPSRPVSCDFSCASRRVHAGNVLLCRWQPREKCSCKFIFLDFFFPGGKITIALLLPAPIFHLNDESLVIVIFLDFFFFFGRKNVIYLEMNLE